MLDKLKKNCSSIVLVVSIVLAGSAWYVWWLATRQSTVNAFESLNTFTVEPWNAMANSPHQHATVIDMAITGSILLACTAVLISPILGAWALLNRLDSRGSQNSQVDGGGENARKGKSD